jgi:hypothetical protein
MKNIIQLKKEEDLEEQDIHKKSIMKKMNIIQPREEESLEKQNMKKKLRMIKKLRMMIGNVPQRCLPKDPF